MPSFLLSGMVMYLLCRMCLKVCDLSFDFTGGLQFKRLPQVSEETLDFRLFNDVETVGDCGTFEAGLKPCIMIWP